MSQPLGESSGDVHNATPCRHCPRHCPHQVVSSDHSAYNFDGPTPAAAASGANPASKLMHPIGSPDRTFAKVPMGLPGLETRLPLLFSAGVQGGRLDLLTFAGVCATNPAKLYGLYVCFPLRLKCWRRSSAVSQCQRPTSRKRAWLVDALLMSCSPFPPALLPSALAATRARAPSPWARMPTSRSSTPPRTPC